RHFEKGDGEGFQLRVVHRGRCGSRCFGLRRGFRRRRGLRRSILGVGGAKHRACDDSERGKARQQDPVQTHASIPLLGPCGREKTLAAPTLRSGYGTPLRNEAPEAAETVAGEQIRRRSAVTLSKRRRHFFTAGIEKAFAVVTTERRLSGAHGYAHPRIAIAAGLGE